MTHPVNTLLGGCVYGGSAATSNHPSMYPQTRMDTPPSVPKRSAGIRTKETPVAIYPPTAEPFCCAICLKNQPTQRFGWPEIRSKPPICWPCEQEWGTGPYGELNPDKRAAKQISALSECIKVEAYLSSKNMESMYGRA